MKMQKLIMLLIGVIISINAFAQYFPPLHIRIDKYTVLDSAYLKVSYKHAFVKDTLKAESKSEDIQVLLVGRVISKYFSQNYMDDNEYVAELIKKGLSGGGIPFSNKDMNSYEIFSNYPLGKITVTDLGSSLIGNYTYEDEINNIKWEISSEKMTILSYPCQKATTKFRGRIYEAWFTTEIPINKGPWKFWGLPGLIMKVSDLQKHYVFECIGLEHLKKKEPIKYFDLNYTKISRRNLDKLYRRFHKDFAAYLSAIGGGAIEMSDTGEGTIIKNSKKQLPYNPMERK